MKQGKELIAILAQKSIAKTCGRKQRCKRPAGGSCGESRYIICDICKLTTVPTDRQREEVDDTVTGPAQLELI